MGANDDSKTLRGGYGSHGMGQGKYVTLDGFEMAVLGRDHSAGLSRVPGLKQARLRGDVEAALYAK